MPCSRSSFSLTPLVYDVEGRTVAVQPGTQIVWWMVVWLTSTFSAPGGSAYARSSEAPFRLLLGGVVQDDTSGAARQVIRTREKGERELKVVHSSNDWKSRVCPSSQAQPEAGLPSAEGDIEE